MLTMHGHRNLKLTINPLHTAYGTITSHLSSSETDYLWYDSHVTILVPTFCDSLRHLRKSEVAVNLVWASGQRHKQFPNVVFYSLFFFFYNFVTWIDGQSPQSKWFCASFLYLLLLRHTSTYQICLLCSNCNRVVSVFMCSISSQHKTLHFNYKGQFTKISSKMQRYYLSQCTLLAKLQEWQIQPTSYESQTNL
jgi:hypothetical protein